MHLSTEPRIAAPAGRVRLALRDPALLAATLPGARIHTTGDAALHGTLALWVGDRSLAARGEAELGPPAGDDGPVTWLVSADHDDGDGSLDGAVRVEILPAPGGCRLRFEVTGNARGWGGPADGRALRHTADRLVGQLARNLEAALTGTIPRAGTTSERTASEGATKASPGSRPSGLDDPTTGGRRRRPGGRALTVALVGALVAGAAAVAVNRRRRR